MNTFNLLGDIVQDDSQRWFESDVVPAMVIGWLAKQDGDVEININSLGGSVTGGLAIANAIKGYAKGKVTANVLGVAASMASVVACAADEIKMGKGAFLMIHNPWTIAMGDAADIRKEADTLDKMKDAIIGFYQSKFSVPAMELAKLMDDETWIEDKDCELYGLAATPYAPEEGDGLKAAAKCDTRMMFARAPEAATAYYAHKDHPAPKSPAPTDWEARFKGLQAAKDKELAEMSAKYKADLVEQSERLSALLVENDTAHAAALAERDERITNLQADIAEKTAALDAAKAEAEQLRAKVGEAEKALAETRAALEAETKRYREQVGLALQQPGAHAEELHGRELALAALRARQA
jgi:ATP-dependent protease ClpP protease subunit